MKKVTKGKAKKKMKIAKVLKFIKKCSKATLTISRREKKLREAGVILTDDRKKVKLSNSCLFCFYLPHHFL